MSAENKRSMTRPGKIVLAISLLVFSWWSVYTRYVDLAGFDLVTNQPWRQLSMHQYLDTLAGTRPFPYQWRVLAFWIVRAVEVLTKLDPHLIDVTLKTLTLTASALLLYLFSLTIVDAMGALLTTAIYLLVTAAAFASEGYAIYFSNDYLLVAGWFAAVYALRRRQWALAALATFIAAWSKETIVIVVILVALEAWQRRAPWSAVVLCAAAFAVPTIVLRAMYEAPIQDWVWWHSVRLNVPFVVWSLPALEIVVRNNLKVFLFLNVLWLLALRAWRRTTDPFLRSLGITLICYLAMAWMVVYIRELRHSLPVTVLVLPLAVGEIEAFFAPAPLRNVV